MVWLNIIFVHLNNSATPLRLAGCWMTTQTTAIVMSQWQQHNANDNANTKTNVRHEHKNKDNDANANNKQDKMHFSLQQECATSNNDMLHLRSTKQQNDTKN